MIRNAASAWAGRVLNSEDRYNNDACMLMQLRSVLSWVAPDRAVARQVCGFGLRDAGRDG
jgi:hypothetical protein